jgi:5,10-methylenetetrahydromethanopterin reductase
VKFGLSLGASANEPFNRTVEVAQQAEAMGFDCLWFVDSQLVCKDVFVTLSLCSANTSRIHLGTGVSNPITRHPTVLANSTASVNEISGGRVILGIGSGDSAVRSLGLKAASISEIEECISTLRKLFSGETLDFGGKRIRLGMGKGNIPIFIAASKPRMLELAGKVADGVVLMTCAMPDYLAQQIEHIRTGAKQSGRSFEDIYTDVWITISVREDEKQAINDVKGWVSGACRHFAMVADRLPPNLVRFKDEILGAAKGYDFNEHLSIKAKHNYLVSDELASTLAIAGDTATCIKRIQELFRNHEQDVKRITMTLLSGGRFQRLKILGEEVIPKLG